MKKFRLMLAPIERVAGPAFRSVCCKYGADMAFTELARIRGLAENNGSTLSRIIIPDNTPTQIQILGSKEALLEKFLSKFTPSPGFAGFNINLGCPSPEIISLGQGCAMIKRVSKVESIVQLIRKQGYPVSIKMRLGMNLFEKRKKVYLNLIKASSADFFIVHARHGMEGYSDLADFTVYPECAETGKEIIANGDIKTLGQVEILKKMGVSGAMIGRAAVEDPSIFLRLKGMNGPSKEEIIKECAALAVKLGELPKYMQAVAKHSVPLKETEES